MNFGLYPIAVRNLMRDAETRPEIEIYDLGQLYNLRQAVQLAGLFDQAPASPAEAREYLRLKGADRVAF